jgi:hypothetical protein
MRERLAIYCISPFFDHCPQSLNASQALLVIDACA